MSIGRRLFIRVQSGVLGSASELVVVVIGVLLTDTIRNRMALAGRWFCLSARSVFISCPLTSEQRARSSIVNTVLDTPVPSEWWETECQTFFPSPPLLFPRFWTLGTHFSQMILSSSNDKPDNKRKMCVLADWQLSPLSVYFCRIHARVGQMTSPTHWRHFTSLYYEMSVADLNQTRTFKPWINE